MHSAITVGGLLMAAFGALMTFAAGMSDAAADGTAGRGCAVFVVGVALVVACVWGLL
jgi:hypothetical protein